MGESRVCWLVGLLASPIAGEISGVTDFDPDRPLRGIGSCKIMEEEYTQFIKYLIGKSKRCVRKVSGEDWSQSNVVSCGPYCERKYGPPASQNEVLKHQCLYPIQCAADRHMQYCLMRVWEQKNYHCDATFPDYNVDKAGEKWTYVGWLVKAVNNHRYAAILDKIIERLDEKLRTGGKRVKKEGLEI
jgi:hypothetical protein